ncbi:efflux RND transporter periplasmic adaptor subunit [bacterium]|nr:efflux RND transporter periplasmic adaptor subunit [bacterium]
MKKALKIIITLAIIISIGYYGLKFLNKKNQTKTESTLVDLKTAKVELGEIATQIDITGEIEPETIVEIKSKVSGKIIKFYKNINDYVKAGDLIATIEIDYQQANTITNTRSNLDLAEIRYKWAKRDFEDIKVQYEAGFATKYSYDAAEKDLEQAELNYTIAQEQYKQVEEIDTKGEESKIYSSVSGTVITRTVEEGEMVSSIGLGNSDGTAIMQIADLSKMIVNSNINEIDINKYQEGQTATITIPANPDHIYNGVITQVAAMASNVNNAKVFPIEIELSDVDNLIKPGMTAEITIKGQSKSDIPIIPITALFSNEKGQDVVYTIENGQVKDTKVIQTGINNMSHVEVISGVEVGEEISLVPPSLLKVDEVK